MDRLPYAPHSKADLDTIRRHKGYTAREVYLLVLEGLHAAEPDLTDAA